MPLPARAVFAFALLAIFPPSLWAQTAEQTAPKGAEARRSAQATMQTFLSAMNAQPRDLEAAIACLDSTGRDAAVGGSAPICGLLRRQYYASYPPS